MTLADEASLHFSLGMILGLILVMILGSISRIISRGHEFYSAQEEGPQ